MRKRLTVTVLLSALFIFGCAKKEVVTKSPNNRINDGSTTNRSSFSNGVKNGLSEYNYENVDRYNGNNREGYSYNEGYIGGVNGGVKNIYFGVDEYVITPDKLYIINGNVKVLKSLLKYGGKVKIEGHCDATGTDEYNYALGLRRAKSAKDAIVSGGIEPSKIITVSMGESSPECTSGTGDSCYAKNRRVEFKISR